MDKVEDSDSLISNQLKVHKMLLRKMERNMMVENLTLISLYLEKWEDNQEMVEEDHLVEEDLEEEEEVDLEEALMEVEEEDLEVILIPDLNRTISKERLLIFN